MLKMHGIHHSFVCRFYLLWKSNRDWVALAAEKNTAEVCGLLLFRLLFPLGAQRHTFSLKRMYECVECESK